MSLFDVTRFEGFCSKLQISTKESGVKPLKWLGTQRYAVNEIAEGLQRGVHTFVILKGRQLGISTVTLALDIYWLLKHPGLQGLLVTDTDENREIFRSYLAEYIAALPPSVSPTVGGHNRTQLTLSTGRRGDALSRLVYLVAGTKKQGNLGRGKAGNFMHATECSSWGDEEGYASLMNTLAQKNPNRLYVFESTARGYNMFYQQWETAKESPTQKAIFIGWWRNELYRWERDHVNFKTYWDGAPSSEERVWIREVFENYGYNISPEQIAWWRWYVDEQMKGDETIAMQEMPPTEDYAFQLSGSRFFSSERVNAAYQHAVQAEAMHYKYRFGLNFEDTEFIPTNADNAEVTIYEMPAERGVYIIGADPAYGSSEWADEFAACGCRCFADRLVQAFEVGTVDWTEQQYAWAIMHLAGWYGTSMIALEMQGPGTTVFNEMQNLRARANTFHQKDPRAGAFDVIGNVRDYFWRKQDSMMGGYAYQWQTNSREKIRMFSTLRSYFEREQLDIRSPACVQQFRNIHRNGDQIGGEGRAKDDRVVALAIATVCWNDSIMREMMAANRTYQIEMRAPEVKRVTEPTEHNIIKYLNRQGIKLKGVNA